jgi:hypothetical protein
VFESASTTKSCASPPATRKATTPAASGVPGGNFGLGNSPLLTATIRQNSISAAASVAGTRSLRRNQAEKVMAVSEPDATSSIPHFLQPRPPDEQQNLQIPIVFGCRNRNPRQPSRSNGLRAGLYFQYDSYERHGLDAMPCAGNRTQPIADVQPLADNESATET